MTSWHFAHEQDVYWICDPCNGGSASPALARALDELGVLTPASHPTAPAPGQSPAAAAVAEGPAVNAPPKPYERFLQSLPARIDAHAGKPRATVFERLRQEFRAARRHRAPARELGRLTCSRQQRAMSRLASVLPELEALLRAAKGPA